MELLPHLRPLRALVAVVQAGSSQRAATLLHVAQSSVARAVQQLELAMGGALLLRSGRGMQPNALGQRLALRAQRALELLAAADCHKRRPSTISWTDSPLALGLSQRHVQTLLALQQSGSEGKAAQALGLSQSAVHQSLSQLEHLAGSTLFVRTRGGLRLDEAGANLLRAVQLALAELRQAEDEWPQVHGRLQGRLVIGTLPFSTTMLLAPAVSRVLDVQADVQVAIVDGTFDALVQQLRSAQIDCIVGALRPTSPAADVQQEVLFEDRLSVVARRDHPLAQRRTLQWRHLAQAQWVMPMPQTPAAAAFAQMLQSAGMPAPPDALHVNSALMMLAFLAEGDRLALMSPRQVARELEQGQLVELPLLVRHTPRRIGVMLRAGYLPTPAAAQLLDALRAAAATL
ncbi:LysR family transcriptional regulator [Rhodoferax sp. GW822-FHT02A01]|uniref:LysR family transcriptional regulator n=1 Tax=Rhodoferax sp. GW822-FHT02A01 TaxID=3141537 RepID=UPI00315DF993